MTSEEHAAELVLARVSEVQKESYKVLGNFGEANAKLKGNVFYGVHSKYVIYPAVGDVVLLKHYENGIDIIFRVLDRKSAFLRSNPGMMNVSSNEAQQVVAANFDYVLIMESLNKDFNIRKIERYLTAAWNSGATPVVVLTKSDLCEDVDNFVALAENTVMGVDVIPISVITGEGLEKLKKYVCPLQTIVLLGASGIGKSSLVNTLADKEIMKVSEIREKDDKGRHTTTYRQMIVLPNGSIVIDTPGMRELAIWDASYGINEIFKDILEFSQYCRFKNCNHEAEPGCAVKKAIEMGDLSDDRLKSYKKLLRENQRNSDKVIDQLKRNNAIKKLELAKHSSKKR